MAHSQRAALRLQGARNGEPGNESFLNQLQRLFMHVDAQLATTIERGLHDKLYFVSVKWLPAGRVPHTNLILIVQEELRPRSIPAVDALVPGRAGRRTSRH